MPRAGDAHLNGALPVSHDPLNRIQTSTVTQPFDLQAFLDQWTQFFEDYGLPIIEGIIGTPLAILSALLEMLQNIIDAIVNALTGSISIGNPIEALGSALADLTGVVSAIFNTAGQASTAAFDWLNGFFNAVTGQSQNSVTPAQASEQAAALAEAQLANAIALAALQAQQDGNTNSGLFSSDDFERVAATDINGADGAGFWAKTSSSSDATGGFYAIADGHTASFVLGSSVINQFMTFRRTRPEDMHTQSLYQKVSLVIGGFIGDAAFFSDTPYIRLRVRVNDADDEEVFCEITSSFTAQFGYRNGGSEVMIGSPVGIDPYGAGTTFTLVAGTPGGVRQFQLMKAGGIIHTWNDSGALSAAVDGTNNGWGWGAFATYYFGGRRRSADVGIITIADNTPSPVLGTTASAYRAATGSISCSSGALPNGVFDTLDYGSGDITWNSTTGEFTVTKTGTYLISLTLRDTANMGSTTHSEGALYTGSSTPAATLVRRRVTMVSGSGVTSFGPFGIHITEHLYLTAGTIVRGGSLTDAGNRTIIGDAAGTETRFSITKVG